MANELKMAFIDSIFTLHQRGWSQRRIEQPRIGRSSDCERYRLLILAWPEQGLSGQRIYQDLVSGHGFGGSYYSVRRFVGRLQAKSGVPVRRMECAGHPINILGLTCITLRTQPEPSKGQRRPPRQRRHTCIVLVGLMPMWRWTVT